MALLMRGLRQVTRASSAVLLPRRGLPVCTVDTNLTDGELPDDFHTGLSDVIAKTLNKPNENISVSVRTNGRMCRNTNENPTAVVQIWSVGVFDAQKNPSYTTRFFEYLIPKLNMPAERISVMYHPLQPQNAAHMIQLEQQFLLNLP